MSRFLVWESSVEHSLHQGAFRSSFRMEHSLYLIICFVVECEDFSLSVYDQSKSDRLHTSCRELWLNLSPKHRRKFETYETVKHTTCLLSVHEVHVYLSRIFNCIQDGILCNFLENNSFCIFLAEFKSFIKMP